MCLDRDTLGRIVHEAWSAYGLEKDGVHLVPYERSSEASKEFERYIGEKVSAYVQLELLNRRLCDLYVSPEAMKDIQEWDKK